MAKFYNFKEENIRKRYELQGTPDIGGAHILTLKEIKDLAEKEKGKDVANSLDDFMRMQEKDWYEESGVKMVTAAKVLLHGDNRARVHEKQHEVGLKTHEMKKKNLGVTDVDKK